MIYQRIRRRDFLVASGSALLAGVPRRAKAAGPNEKLRTAHIGVGGMGSGDLASISSHPDVEVAAICDVDQNNLSRAQEKFSHAKPYQDFRQMVSDLHDQIDAVVVSTPDHTHAPAAMTALLHDKPVYCQKPLTHDIYEARQLRRVAEKRGLVTQMGIQVHASPEYRSAIELIRSGTIGKVKEVHAWSSKNWGYDGPKTQGQQPIPSTLNWNLWLGTAAERRYHQKIYHPGQWRKLIDFGTGTLGDMGVHIFDTPFAALQLSNPNWVQTSCRAPTGVGHPEKNRVVYEFPGTKYTTSRLIWKWYDGQYAPPDHQPLGLKQPLPGQGSLFIGEQGKMLLPHVGSPILLPEKKFRDLTRPTPEPLNHYHQFVDACFGRTRTAANFGYAGPLTEALLLGVVANRFPDQKLTWDAAKMRVTNIADANALIRRSYREGFEVEELS